MDHPSARPPTSRRAVLTVLLGGGALAGCGGQPAPRPKAKASPTGPIIRQQDAGTLIRDEDLRALADNISTALRNADADALAQVVPHLDREAWQRKLDAMKSFPLEDVGCVFQEISDGQQMNSAGGAVSITVALGFTHRVVDCDSRPVYQLFDAELAKADPSSPVRLRALKGPQAYGAMDDDFKLHWDLPGAWTVLQSPHVVLAAQAADVEWSRSNLAEIDRGVEEAFALLAPRPGVSKLFVSVSPPGSPLFGGASKGDAAGVAFSIPYVDPADLDPSKPRGNPSVDETARILLHRDNVGDDVHGVALHESVHAMALRWGTTYDPWIAEGLATWAERGMLAGLRGDAGWRAQVRSSYAGFARRLSTSAARQSQGFYGGSDEADNYACAGATYAYLESKGGRAGVLAAAKKLYEGDLSDTGDATQADRAVDRLFADTQRWVASL